MSDVVEQGKSMLSTIEYARAAGITQACPDSSVAGVVSELVAEVERLREAVTAADAILSLLHHRGLVNSENNRRDVAEVSEKLARLRRSDR